MPLSFAGKNLIPAPFLDIQEEFSRGDDGRLKKNGYTISLTGTIVNIDDSLDSPGATSGLLMNGVLSGQAYLKSAFSVDYGNLVITPPDNNTYGAVTGYCRPLSLEFTPGTWTNRCDFRATLHCDSFSDDPSTTYVDQQLQSTSDSFSIQENEDATYAITHNMQARGLSVYGPAGLNDPLSVAKGWVQSRSYNIDSTGQLSVVSGQINFSNLINSLPSGTNYWNKSTNETIDVSNYTYSLVETFIYSPSGNAIENYVISFTTDFTNNAKITANIQGTVRGLSNDNKNYNQKFSNALSKFNTTAEPSIYSRVVNVAPVGYAINPLFITKQVTKNQFNGTIEYSAGFVGTSGNSLIPNSIEESIEITDSIATDIFAIIGIPGRARGNLFQNMQTVTNPSRSINISAVLAPSGYIGDVSALSSAYSSKPNTNAIISALKPSAGFYYLTTDQEGFSPFKRTYSRTVTWQIDPQGANITGLPSGINNKQ